MKPQFETDASLLPAIIQDSGSGQVLMLGHMNREAYELTISTGRVTFYSRSRNTIWVKGETSGNYLELLSVSTDCDRDAILVVASPSGPTCHTGSYSCFGEQRAKGFLHKLQDIISSRANDNPGESYTASLLAGGINKVAQKVGEEAVEVVIASKDNDVDEFKAECADLLYHLSVLLKVKNVPLEEVEALLRDRHEQFKRK